MIECEFCRKLFKPRKRYGHEDQPDQKYCGRKCYFAHREIIAGKRLIAGKCNLCGKEIRRWPSQMYDINYCSKSCANRANHPVNNPNKIYLPQVPVNCENCKKQFFVFPHRQKIAKFCSKGCYYEHKSTTKPKARQNGLRNLPNKCMICDFDITIAVHHIIPKREGGKDEISNLAILCPNHHAMADRNLISREELFSLNRAAIAQLRENQLPSHQPLNEQHSTVHI